MSPESSPAPDRSRPSLVVRVGHSLRRYFVAGLAALFPAAVTIYLLVMLFRFLDGLLGRYLAFRAPGLGLVLTVLILLLVGFLSTHFFGRVIFPTLEAGFSRLPIVRQIYPAIKQLSQFLFGGKGGKQSLQRVVLVQYPRPGIYTLAFVTHETPSSITGTQETILTLLVPTPPSPFSGPLLFVPDKEVIPLTMPIEEALKLIVSGGVVSSPLQSAGR